MSADPEAVTFPNIHALPWTMPRVAPAAYQRPTDDDSARWVAAEAWAWRCADTMPDTAQGRRDSEADAETLRLASRELAYGSNGDKYLFSAGELGGTTNAANWAETRAHAALLACPALRGGPDRGVCRICMRQDIPIVYRPHRITGRSRPVLAYHYEGSPRGLSLGELECAGGGMEP